MINAMEMHCGCVCASKRLSCVLPSETSRETSSHFLGERRLQWSCSERDISAREDYESNRGLASCNNAAKVVVWPRRPLLAVITACAGV